MRRRIAILVLALIALALVFVPRLLAPPKHPLVGKMVPAVEVPMREGAFTTTARGKPIVIWMWSSWCDDCDWNAMDDLAKRVDVIAIATADERANIEKFLEAHPTKMKVAFDDGDRAARALDLADVPSVMVVGANGIVRFVHLGPTDPREVEQFLGP